MKKNYFVIINPASNNGRTKKLLPVIYGKLSNMGFTLNIKATGYPGHATELSSGISHRDYSGVIAIGGDGTYNEIINGLGKKKIPIGFIRTGSGNDFTKNFLPDSDLDEQINIAFHGKIKRIDIGSCNGKYYLNSIGIGFDGQVTEEIQKKGKKIKGHNAYMLAVVKNFLKYREPEMCIKWEKKVINDRIFSVSINNGTTVGGGFMLTPNAVIDDGKLDVCLVRKAGLFRRYLSIQKVKKGTHNELPEVEIFRTKEISIESDQKIVAHMDGEFIGEGPFKIKILPRFLNIRVP